MGTWLALFGKMALEFQDDMKKKKKKETPGRQKRALLPLPLRQGILRGVCFWGGSGGSHPFSLRHALWQHGWTGDRCDCCEHCVFVGRKKRKEKKELAGHKTLYGKRKASATSVLSKSI